MNPSKMKIDDLKTKKRQPYEAKSGKGKEKMKNLFFEAIERSLITQLEECLIKKVNPNMLNDRGEPALHIAAEKGDMNLCSILISMASLDLNITDGRGTTAVMIAVKCNYRTFARVLLRNGANPNLRDVYENMALHYAVQNSNIGLVYDLVWFGAHVTKTNNAFEQTVLSLSVIEYPNFDIAKYLLKKGAKQEDKIFSIPFEAALNCNTEERLDVFDILITFGQIDINQKQPISGMTCLHIAALTGYVPLAQYLLKNGANVEIRDAMKRTARDIAQEHGNRNISNFLNKSKKRKSVGFVSMIWSKD